MIVIPETKQAADALNAIQIELDCFCEIKKSVFKIAEWDLTSKAEKLLGRLLMSKAIPADMTINSLATLINNGDYIFGGDA